jgi:glycosyltransferase involved in cell wall biosynthesis
MKILGLTNLYPSPWFPLRGIFNKQMFSALAEQDEVRLIVPISWTDEGRVGRNRGPGLEPGRRSNLHGIEAEHPRYVFPPRVLRGRYGFFFQKSIQRVFRRVVKEFNPDVVLAAWAYPDGWAALRLGHASGLPVVVKLHGSDVLVQSKIPASRRRIIECVQQADGVVTVSRDLASKAIGLGADPKKVSTVYCGVDQKIFHPGDRAEARRRLDLPADDPILLFIGNLVAVKGIDVLLDACRQIADGQQRFTCHLIGQGPLRGMLQERIERLGLSGRVRLVGPIPHAQLAEWYRAATVFVLPSRSEGVPCVLLEAAACQTPFVASRVGGIPEMAGWGSSTLVPPDDAPALAEAIGRALAEPVKGPIPRFTRTFDDTALEMRAVLRQAIEARSAGSSRKKMGVASFA